MANPYEQFANQGATPAASNPYQQFAPDRPQTSKPAALMEGMKEGASFGLHDELYGAYRASGIPEMLDKLDPHARPSAVGALITALIGAGKVGLEHLTGKPGEASSTYEKARDEVRATSKQAQEDQPGTFIAGQAAGALAVPIGAGANAATLPARMLASARVGAGVGALSGFGSGEGAADSAVKTGSGAVLGGAVGAAGPPVVEGLIQGGRAIAGPIVNAVRGAVNPENEAARRVAVAVGRDVQNDPNAVSRLTPQEFVASTQQPGGGPATLMDLGGETTRALARSAANTSPEGRAVLNQSINDRFEGQSGRVTSWLENTFNYPNAQAQQTAIEQTARGVNRAAYGRAMRDPNAQSMWTPELQQLTAAPAVQDAIRSATSSGANRAVAEGARPPVNPFQFAPDGTMTMRPGVTPSLQFWDQVKKNLDGQIGVARRAGNDALVNELQPLRTGLIRHLDETVPAYQQARAGAAHFFGAENALEAGQNFVGAGNRFGNREARAAIAGMTPTERQLFQDGYVSRLVEKLNASGDRRSILNQIAQSPAAREELHIALGAERAGQIEAGLRVEGIMDLARGATQGNSTTARQWAELTMAGGAAGLGGIGTYNMDPHQMTIAAVTGALVGGGRHIDQRVAQRVAQMLVSQDPRQLMLGIRIAARNDRMMNNLRAADQKLAAAGAQQTSRLAPSMQGPVRAGAQDEQPQPEGVINQQP